MVERTKADGLRAMKLLREEAEEATEAAPFATFWTVRVFSMTVIVVKI